MIFITFFVRFCLSKGKAEMVIQSVNVASVYTIKAFVLFEKEFIDGAGYKYNEVESVSCHRRFEV